MNMNNNINMQKGLKKYTITTESKLIEALQLEALSSNRTIRDIITEMLRERYKKKSTTNKDKLEFFVKNFEQ